MKYMYSIMRKRKSMRKIYAHICTSSHIPLISKGSFVLTSSIHSLSRETTYFVACSSLRPPFCARYMHVPRQVRWNQSPSRCGATSIAHKLTSTSAPWLLSLFFTAEGTKEHAEHVAVDQGKLRLYNWVCVVSRHFLGP